MKKIDWLKARATPAERRALEAVARQEGRKPAEMLRELVREAALARGVWPISPVNRATHVEESSDAEVEAQAGEVAQWQH
jgi:hypothetical protein